MFLGFQISLQTRFFYDNFKDKKPLYSNEFLSNFKGINSYLDCLVKCNQISSCISVMFNKLGLECYFFNKTFINFTDDLTFNVYTKKLPNGDAFFSNNFTKSNEILINSTIDDIEQTEINDQLFYFISTRNTNLKQSKIFSL